MTTLNSLTFFLYADALNLDQVNYKTMPFLHELSSHHHQNLENVIGYSFAIQSSMLSGSYPQENDHWLPYFYSPETSPILFKAFGKFSPLLLLDKLPKLRCLSMQESRKIFLKKGTPANNIPSEMIEDFQIYPYYYMNELPFFHELRTRMFNESNAELTYMGPPTIKQNLYSKIIEYISSQRNEREFLLAYDDKLDVIGHKYGPESREYVKYARQLDRNIEMVYRKLKSHFRDNLTFMIFSDHGQCQQTFEFDILSALKRNGIILKKDYLCFVDATLALFWFENTGVQEKVYDLLASLKLGRVLSNEDRKRYRIEFSSRKFGDIIFVLKPGGTFYPNFYSPFGTLKGLHGYLPEDHVQKAFLISDQPLAHKFNHVKDLRNFSLKVTADL